jgi:quercetin dioxygenase-like cupin family protein
MTKMTGLSACTVLCLVVASAGLPVLGEETALVKRWDAPDLTWGSCPEFFPAGCEIAVLHGSPAEANADIFFKVPGDYTIPWHTHTSAERMVLVSGTLRVTYTGQEAAVVNTGAYAYGPGERPHEAFCLPGPDCVLFIAFEEPVDAFPFEAP